MYKILLTLDDAVFHIQCTNTKKFLVLIRKAIMKDMLTEIMTLLLPL